MRASPTTPPTTPPAIAPALLELLDVEDEELPLIPVVGELAGVPVCKLEAAVLGSVPVGLELAVEAGAEANCWAAVILKVSFVTTSKYAQAGIAVPDGIFTGYWDTYTDVQLKSQVLHESTVRF